MLSKQRATRARAPCMEISKSGSSLHREQQKCALSVQTMAKARVLCTEISKIARSLRNALALSLIVLPLNFLMYRDMYKAILHIAPPLTSSKKNTNTYEKLRNNLYIIHFHISAMREVPTSNLMH